MLTPLQERLLEMMRWLDCFLRKNNLCYYALDGTVLGAVRHNGFIPWDDDIDIGLPRTDYERLLSLMKMPIDGYVIESPKSGNSDYFYPYAKMFDTRTTLIENNRHRMRRGVYIDIFPLDGLGDTKKEGLKNYRRIDFLNMVLASKTCALRKSRKWYKNAAVLISRLIPFFYFNKRELCLKIDSLCSKRNYNDCRYVGNLCGTYRKKETYYKDVLGKPTEHQFENINILCPEKTNLFLTILYGDWKKLPPIQRRGTQHEIIYLSLTESYLESPKNE